MDHTANASGNGSFVNLTNANPGGKTFYRARVQLSTASPAIRNPQFLIPTFGAMPTFG
ncbi:MAG: hypothetical protein ACXWJB_11390 [Limisphaerales bacterium]